MKRSFERALHIVGARETRTEAAEDKIPGGAFKQAFMSNCKVHFYFFLHGYQIGWFTRALEIDCATNQNYSSESRPQAIL